MYKIAVVGDRDSVLGFKALGLEVCPAQSAVSYTHLTLPTICSV